MSDTGIGKMLRMRVFMMATVLVTVCVVLVPSTVIAEDGSGPVHWLTYVGPIGPVTTMLIEDAIDAAVEDGAEVLVIALDTPGGLTTSTWDITQLLLNAKVPTVIWVYPSGAGAASAGVYIMYSAHIAAMAPGTNVGSATPVMMGGEVDSTMMSKVENDAAARMRALANRRGRNVEWGERAVHEAASLTAQEASDSNVINFIAANWESLMDSLEGRTVELPHGEKILATTGTPPTEFKISWRLQLLAKVTDPTIAYILMSLGMMGLGMELYHPGTFLPGIVGAICLVLAFFAFRVLPINYAALALFGLALLLFIMEIKIASHGLLSIGGTASMLIGSFMLIDTTEPSFQISKAVIFTVVGFTAAFFIFAITMALKAQRRRVESGSEGLIGLIGRARDAFDREGMVYVAGEYWRAITSVPVQGKEEVRIVAKDGMILRVEPVSSETKG